MHILFPFYQYWPTYLCFTLFISVLLLLDLGLFHRKAHAVSFKEASVWTVVWISLALIFNVFFYYYALAKFSVIPDFASIWGEQPVDAAKRVALEFLAGFVVEKSLAVDNIFIFVVIFTTFAIPAQYQHRVLFYGIVGAVVFRAIFIAMGSILLSYHWIVILFGVFLILTGVKLFFAPKEPIDPSKGPFFRILKRMFRITSELHGDKFFIRKGTLLYATPLFVSLMIVEFSDILFAIDSVPAIFAITREPFIVFTSNILAILGLRSLYFLLAGAYSLFHLLKYGLGIILIFVGLKMAYLNELFGGKFPISWSLAFIMTTLMLSIALSLVIKPQQSSVKE